MTCAPLDFMKMQGVGNDFVVFDARRCGNRDWFSLAPRLCDRRFGIGADGVLVVDSAEAADAAMRMYNPDGTEDFCGNGLRCVARYVVEGGLGADGVRPKGSSPTRLTIETIAGPRRAVVYSDRSVTVEMGMPQFEADAIPIAIGRSLNDGSALELTIDDEELRLFALSTGTTHAVVFVDELPDDARFSRISPQIECHSAFPKRTSVIWTRVDGKDRLSIRIWERGAGETWGCGSGACAAAAASRTAGFTGDVNVVISRGGELTIAWDGVGPIHMTGPAEFAYRGRVDV